MKESGSHSKLFETILASSIHDMKNSVTLLLAKLQRLPDHTNPNTASNNENQQLKQLGTNIQNKLIQLLAIYRIQNKQYYLDIDEHYLKEYLQEIINTIEKGAMVENIKLKIVCTDELHAYFDRELVSGIIHNIVGNALRYATSLVEVHATLNSDNQLLIRICDDGPGYPQHMLDSYDEKYSKISFNNGNTGLGLYFCTLVAEMHTNNKHNGYVTLDNQGINKGSRFTLVLP